MRTALLPVWLVLAACGTLAAADEDAAAFFEAKIRPILSDRCQECHSTGRKTKAGLSLDSRADWLKGGDSGPAIVPGKPEASLLLKAVSWRDPDLQMPPKKKLGDAEVQALTEWVQRGAYDPRTPGAPAAAPANRALSVEDGRGFWAYAPFKTIAPPTVKDAAWPRTEIDRFILAGMEAHDLRPAADAAPEALARRLVFVLTGLPPSPEQVARFVTQAGANRAQAIDGLTTELLASPAFAERFASHWLDIARFAESSGGGRTLLFKDAWRFRDYVVQAFARNRPLDQLIREHLAGDLLPAATPEERSRNLIATGFLALGPTIYEEQDKQRLRFDVIDEQLDTIGKAFLGQTIGCARCHDHKFDPIPQRDYYALAGIFASTRTLSNYSDNVVRWIDAPLPLPPGDEKRIAEAEAQLDVAERRLKEAKDELAKPKSAKSPGAQAASALREEVSRLEKQISLLTQIKDGRPLAMSVREEDTIGDTNIRIRGEVHQNGAVVPRGFLSVLGQGAAPPPATQSGRRELAEWLVGHSNPLTARVLVNRVWSWLVGQGLVRSVDNFGTTGEAPSHPELLDYLARRFQDEGWNVQALIREIIRSRTWQLAVAPSPADPDNRWLSHAVRQRLDAEQLRDAMLMVSGTLDRTVGGANIRGANAARSDSFAASSVEFGYQFGDARRSLYTPAFRNNRLELFALFDFSDNNSVHGQRQVSTVAPQALFFMNNAFVLEQARTVAKRIAAQSGSLRDRLGQLFVTCLGRPPLPSEATACTQLLQHGAADVEAWAMTVQALFGSVAFRYLD